MPGFFTSKRKIFLGLVAVLFLLNIVVWQDVFDFAGPRYLKVTVLDVGQGDSIFIETPAMRHILIDGGPDTSVLEKLSRQLPFWQRRLDMVILTHPDADHVAGLLHVLKRYRVDYMVWSGGVRDGGNYEECITLLEKQKNQGGNVIIAKSGLQIKSGNAVLDVLHPFKDLSGEFLGKEGNDAGVVMQLEYGAKSFLFTADISNKVEQAMIDEKVDVLSDVLKVAHHGSKYSSSEAFLQAVSPSLAVISSGKKNMYGHPAPEALQRLEKFGITTLRTDQDGDVEMISDGESIKLSE